jgi:2-polyprenyl-6-methoxyphenol hydroxylase-like FAD-dependent oxidoreductase
MVNIIGGGIAGMTAAAVLSKLGIKCEIFEKNNKNKLVGGTITLFPNSIRILKKIDIFESIKNKVWTINHAVFLDSNLKYLGKRELGNEKVYGQPTIGIKRQCLIEALQTNMVKLGVNYNYDKYISELNFNKNFSIISDGSASINRLNINNNHTRNFSNIVYFGGYIYSDKSYIENIKLLLKIERYNQTVIINGPSFIGFSIIKNNNDQDGIYWYTHLKSKNPLTKEQLNTIRNNIDIRTIIKLNINLSNNILECIKKTNEVVVSNIYETNADNLCYSNNFIIIGDAAHSINPLSGQGAGMAIEDAYIFGNFLGSNINNKEKDDIFISSLKKIYEKRNKRVSKIQKRALFSCKISSIKLPSFLYYIRNKIFSLQILLIPNKNKNYHYFTYDSNF